MERAVSPKVLHRRASSSAPTPLSPSRFVATRPRSTPQAIARATSPLLPPAPPTSSPPLRRLHASLWSAVPRPPPAMAPQATPPRPPPRVGVQDMAPPGGYASIGVGRNVPKSVGPRASLLMLAGALVMGGGLYRVGTFNVHRRYVAGRVLFLFLGWRRLESGV